MKINSSCHENKSSGTPFYLALIAFRTARTMVPDSAGSQFFVMVADAPHLDGQYAGFGKITEGIDAALEIAQVRRDFQDKPLEPVVIKTVTVE